MGKNKKSNKETKKPKQPKKDKIVTTYTPPASK